MLRTVFFRKLVQLIRMSESVYFCQRARLTRSKLLSNNKPPESSGVKETSVSKLSNVRRKLDKTETEVNVHGDDEERSVDKKGKWEPSAWRSALENIREMRKSRDAPVDTMGCDVISDSRASPEVSLWECGDCQDCQSS